MDRHGDPKRNEETPVSDILTGRLVIKVDQIPKGPGKIISRNIKI
jgi:hypothetical protein